MKKYLSLVLAIALVLTTLVVPMSASAEGETIDLKIAAYNATGEITAENPAYVGDTVNVKIIANVAADTVVAASHVRFSYNESLLMVGELPTGVAVHENAANVLTYTGDTQVTYTGAYELASIPFTVKATGNDTFMLDKDLTSFLDEAGMDYVTYAETMGSIVVNPSSAKVYVNDEELVSGNKYYSPSGVNVKLGEVVGNVTAKMTNDKDVTVVDITDENTPVNPTVTTTYSVVVTLAGVEQPAVTFTVVPQQIDAIVSMDAPVNNDGYTKGTPIEIPVKVSGIGSEVVGMAEFEVTYDPSVLTLTEAENYHKNEGETGTSVTYTILYGDENSLDGTATNNTELVKLVFTVNQNAAYGTTTITLGDGTWAPGGAISPVAPSLGVGAPVSLTVVPAGEFATVAPEVTTGWATEAYGVTVTSDVDVYYLKTKATYEKAEDVLTNGAVEGKTFDVDEEGYNYYVVATTGTDPVVSKLYTVENKLDTNPPEFKAEAVAALNQSTWTNTADAEPDGAIALDVNTLATDATSKVAGFKYSFTSATEGFGAAVTEITITEKLTAEKVWIKAVDNAGNESAAVEVAVKYDGTAPVIDSIGVSDFNEGGTTKTISFTATDANSGVGSVMVAAPGLEAAAATRVGETDEYTFVASVAGEYTITVTDKVGITNTATANVALDHVNVSGVKAAIVKNVDPVEGFVAGKNNGTFTYVKIGANDGAGVVSTLTFAKDDEPVSLENGEDDYYVIDGTTEDAAGTYVVTITTASIDDPENVSEPATYTFTIVNSQEKMKSVDDNAWYNVLDFGRVRNLTKDLNNGQGAIPDDSARFEAGLFSADVTGDLKYTAEDADAIITALKGAEYVGVYTFDILNDFKWSASTAD